MERGVLQDEGLGLWLHRRAALFGSDRLPSLAGRKSNTDNSPNQGAKGWANEEFENSEPADVGVKRVTGSCVVEYSDAEAGQCPKHKAVAQMSSSR
jgi:hypothetical protein